MLSLLKCRTGVLLCGILAFACQRPAQSTDEQPTATPKQAESDTAARQDELDAGLVKMLSGATLEGSFTSTGEGARSDEASREKYTLGEVKKLEGKIWLIPARIQYGEHDVTIPLDAADRMGGRHAGDRGRQRRAAGLRHGVGPRDVLRRSLRRLLEARRARRPLVRRDSAAKKSDDAMRRPTANRQATNVCRLSENPAGRSSRHSK